MHTGRDMDVRTDLVMMIDCTACVKDNVVADARPRIDNDASTNNNTCSDPDITCDDGPRMNSCCKNFSLC